VEAREGKERKRGEYLEQDEILCTSIVPAKWHIQATTHYYNRYVEGRANGKKL